VSPRVFFKDGARVSKRIPRRGARVSRISFQRGARVSKSFSEEEPVSPCCFGRGARVTNSFFQRGARVSHYFYLGELVSLQFFLLGARVSKIIPEWSPCLRLFPPSVPLLFHSPFISRLFAPVPPQRPSKSQESCSQRPSKPPPPPPFPYRRPVPHKNPS
jgi:hypothetical protein